MFAKFMIAILCGTAMAQSVKLMTQDAELYSLKLRLSKLEEKAEPVPHIAPIRRLSIKEFNIEDID